jgi:hypothetical protein
MLCKKPHVAHVQRMREGKKIINDVPVACGKCFHCRVNQANIWQVRLLLEAQTSYDSAFLTLTFDDIHLPHDKNVCPKFLQAFLKRYRKRFEPHRIRYYAIGEYGDKTWRPHYHLAIFTRQTDIKSEARIERCYLPCEDMRKRDLCTHDCAAQLAWPYGNVEVSRTLGKENACYITGYIKKKATKPYYDHLGDRHPEFMTCSTGNKKGEKGGLGYAAVREIAEKFRDTQGSGGRIIRSLRFGGRHRPLGRYLTNKLRSLLNVDPEVSESEFDSYLQRIWDTFTDPGEIERIEAKRHAREKRAELFKGGRQL